MGEREERESEVSSGMERQGERGTLVASPARSLRATKYVRLALTRSVRPRPFPPSFERVSAQSAADETPERTHRRPTHSDRVWSSESYTPTYYT